MSSFTYSALGSGLNGVCFAIALDSTGNLYAGGSFTNASGVPVSNIAKWTVSTSTWSALGNGLNGTCLALAFNSTENTLYAGGTFTTAGGNPANRIAKWTVSTSTWSALGNGLTSGSGSPACRAIAFDTAGNLYAGGQFTTAGTATVSNIAKWTVSTSTWSALTGGGLSGGANIQCYTIAFNSTENDLYAGGQFTTAGTATVNNIAKWNGTTWSAIGSGFNGACQIIVFNSTENILYAGGLFTTAGGNTATYIANWNGTAWSAIGSGFNSGCNAIAFDLLGRLYAAGSFSTAGGNSVNSIAVWDGSSWSAVGTQSVSVTQKLILNTNTGYLYVGGSFSSPLAYIALIQSDTMINGGLPSNFNQTNVDITGYFPAYEVLNNAVTISVSSNSSSTITNEQTFSLTRNTNSITNYIVLCSVEYTTIADQSSIITGFQSPVVYKKTPSGFSVTLYWTSSGRNIGSYNLKLWCLVVYPYSSIQPIINTLNYSSNSGNPINYFPQYLTSSSLISTGTDNSLNVNLSDKNTALDTYYTFGTLYDSVATTSAATAAASVQSTMYLSATIGTRTNTSFEIKLKNNSGASNVIVQTLTLYPQSTQSETYSSNYNTNIGGILYDLSKIFPVSKFTSSADINSGNLYITPTISIPNSTPTSSTNYIVLISYLYNNPQTGSGIMGPFDASNFSTAPMWYNKSAQSFRVIFRNDGSNNWKGSIQFFIVYY